MKTILYAVAIALSLSACKETPQETANDVAEARKDGAEEVREAQADRRETVNDAATGTNGMVASNDAEDIVDADYDVSVTKAKAALDVEQEKCEAMEGTSRDDCKAKAMAAYDGAVADAEMARAKKNDAQR